MKIVGMVDVVSIHFLIKAHLMHLHVVKARDVIDQMEEQRVHPNRLAFNGLINAMKLRGLASGIPSMSWRYLTWSQHKSLVWCFWRAWMVVPNMVMRWTPRISWMPWMSQWIKCCCRLWRKHVFELASQNCSHPSFVSSRMASDYSKWISYFWKSDHSWWSVAVWERDAKPAYSTNHHNIRLHCRGSCQLWRHRRSLCINSSNAWWTVPWCFEFCNLLLGVQRFQLWK